MAGVQDGRLAVAVSNAGGLGSLPCGMLDPAGMRAQLEYVAAHTTRPYNVNFFCHPIPTSSEVRDARWRAALAPYYRECELDIAAVPHAMGRTPFSADYA